MIWKSLIFSVLILMVTVSGCHKEVFNPKAIESDYFIENIPTGFTWSTTSPVSAKVTPDDQYDGQYPYTFEFFDKNPLATDSAVLQAIGWGTSKHPMEKNIILPESQTSVFIRQTTPGKRVSVMELPVENHTVSGSFASQTTITENRTAFRQNYSMLAATAKETNPPAQIPQDAIEITNQNYTLASNKNYVISGTYTGSLDFSHVNGVSVYVKGIWNNTAKETEINTANLYIMDGGKVLSGKEWEIQIHSNAQFTIAENAQFGSKEYQNIEMTFENKGTLINEGSVYIEKIEIKTSNVSVINYNKFHLEELDSENPSNFNNMDGGECYIKNAEIKNLIITNQCYMEIEKLELKNAATFTIASGSAIKCKNLEKKEWGQTKFELYDKALFEVTEKAEISAPLTFSGLGRDFALIKFNIIGSGKGTNTVSCKGNLYIEYQKRIENSKFWKIQAPAQIVDANAGSLINIPKSKCNQGNNYQPEQPTLPEFPKRVTYNKSYTYASEDNYPSPGDYDLNDIVTTIDSITYYYEAQNKVSQMICHTTLRAVGATRLLGAAIQLDAIKSGEIANITYSKDLPQDNFRKNSNGTEKGAEQAVIPLFDNAHKTLGLDNTTTIVNTISNNPKSNENVAPNAFDITIKFVSPVEDYKIATDQLNYFTIVGIKLPRREIHLPKYKHTELSNASQKLQEVTTDYMWTIKVPGHFHYPHEWTRVTDAYKNFKAWVQSGGENNKDWYSTQIDESKLYQK